MRFSGSNNTILHTGARASKIGSDWLRIHDGTAPVPALSFEGDTDTGFFREGPDWVSLSLGATRRFGWTTTRMFISAGLHLSLDAVNLYSGAGDPAGVLSAPVGSIYLRTDGTAGATLYVKESGTGSTGWVAK